MINDITKNKGNAFQNIEQKLMCGDMKNMYLLLFTAQ